MGPLETPEPRVGTARPAADAPASFVPRFESEERFLTETKDPATWRAAITEICRREGIQPAAEPQLVRAHGHPTVLVPPSNLVKLYASWMAGHSMADAEVVALKRAARDPGLAVPSLTADGWLEEDCRYLVISRIPGVPLRDVRRSLPDRQVQGMAAWMGRFVRRFHAVPLSDEERATGHEDFRRHLGWMRATLVEAAATGALVPPHLGAAIDDWLPTVDELAGRPDDAVLLHGDVHYNHVFVVSSGDGWRPVGVIDLNRSGVGPPASELAAAWMDLRNEPAGTQDAFLEAAGFERHDRSRLARLVLAWALIQRRERAYQVPDIARVRSLDELAARALIGQ
jgi:aminoglycoside phosphotransferase